MGALLARATVAMHAHTPAVTRPRLAPSLFAYLRRVVVGVGLGFGMAGCLGTEDLGAISDTDAGFADGAAPDDDPAPLPRDAGPPPPQEVTIEGRVHELGEYFRGNTGALAEASVITYGVNPALTTISDAAGAYSFRLPANGRVLFFVNKLGHFPTYTEVETQQANRGDVLLWSAENTWVNAVAVHHSVDMAAPFPCHAAPEGALNASQNCVFGMIVGRILDDGASGSGEVRPVEGISSADFTLTVNGGAWFKKGPFFLAADGTPSDSPTSIVTRPPTSGTVQGGLFAVFVEIPQLDGLPAIDVQIAIEKSESGSSRRFGPIAAKVFRPYGVTWVSVPETGTPPTGTTGNVSFDTQIYPMFLPVPQGGFGCQGCHTNQGGTAPAAGMNLFGGPEIAYTSLTSETTPRRVNVSSPDDSLLLKRPLYEQDGQQDHPIFAFASAQDPGYILIRRWIQEGARRTAILPPVSFVRDVRPLLSASTTEGGAGCFACHVVGVDDKRAPAGFFMGDTAGQLFVQLTARKPADNGNTREPLRVNVTYPEQSLLLLNPLSGNAEPHPVKLFAGAADPRYQILYRWIAEGAVDDRISRDEVNSGAFVSQPGYTVHGSATMIRNIGPGTTSVIVEVSGLAPATLYPVHVHAAPCAAGVGGGHYKLDPAVPATLEANEIWANVRTSSAGAGTGVAVVAHLARADAASVVIHDPSQTPPPKMACVDLKAGADVLSEGVFAPLPAARLRNLVNVSGSATLRRWAGGGTEVIVRLFGADLTPGATYPTHLHAAPCAQGDGGGHYKIDTRVTGPLAENEFWPEIKVDALRVGRGEAYASHVARSDAWSIVVHDPSTTPPAKMYCADLQVTNSTNDGARVSNDLFSYGAFKKVDPLNPALITGSAGMVRHAEGQTSVQVEVRGLLATAIYPAHVHLGACAEGLGHYLIDPALPPGETNEISLNVTTSTQGGSAGMAVVPHFARPEAASIVVHDPNAANARLICADLIFGGDAIASGGFVKLLAGEATGVQGLASLRRISSRGTEVQIGVTGLAPNLVYPSHVHRAPCALGEGGGHYLINPAITAVTESNEIWSGVSTDGTGTGIGATYLSHIARPDAASIVIHDPVTRAKIACADLVWR